MTETPQPRDVRPWVIAALLLGVLALHGFADPHPPTGAWGAVGMLALSPLVRFVLIVGAAIVVLPPVSQFVARRGRPVAGGIARTVAGVPPWAWIAMLLAVAWVLRCRESFGDSVGIAEAIRGGEWINHKEPLDRLLTSFVYRAGHAAIDWDAATAIALVNTGAGVLFWAGLRRLRHLQPFTAGSTWIPWTLLASVGTVVMFFGYVESYSFMTAGILWTLVLCLEAVEDPPRPLWPAALAYGITFATHLASAWLAAALPVTWAARVWVRSGRHWPKGGEWWPEVREACACTFLSCVPIALVAGVMAASGVGLGGFSWANFGGGDGKLFVPLFEIDPRAFERFTMFSAAHFAGFGNELLLVAPVGLVLAVGGWLWYRKAQRAVAPGVWVLLAGAAGTVLYAFTFNPDMMVFFPKLGVMADWDLFAFEAVPITMLGAWWLGAAMEPGVERDGIAVAAAVVSFVHTVPWLLLNAGVRL